MANNYKTPEFAAATDVLPWYVRVALNVFLSFIAGTIKNPLGPKAQQLKAIIQLVIDTLSQFLQSIP